MDDVEATGTNLAAIGTGDLAYAEAFAEERDVAFPLMVDEELVSYRAVDAGRAGARALVSPRRVRDGVRALRAGQRQGRTGRHPLVLGATHVIRPDGSVPLAWRNDDVTDNPAVALVLDVLRRDVPPQP